MSSPPLTATERYPASEPRPVPSLPRVLAGLSSHDPMSLEQHLAVHGEVVLGRGHGTPDLIDELERAGLRGHGGAAFPLARKMRAVAGSRRRPVVVVNGAEGEPASGKDRILLQMLPHLLIDGALLAAAALGAREVIIAVCQSEPDGLHSVARAIAERRRHPVGRRAPELTLVPVPAGYVAGQESALVSHLNGGPAKPTFTPPLPFEQGVRRRPTLVANAETLAHVALIARHGAAWFRELGTGPQPGSALVTISGAIARPGVYEIEYGASLSSLIAAGGGTTGRVRAALLGGYAGAWVGAERLEELFLSEEQLAPHGATLGAGIIVLLSEIACPVAETVRVARWLAGQSARQCGPCLFGLDALAEALEAVAEGRLGDGDARARISALGRLTRRRGACAHPDGAVRFIASAVRTFADEFADHALHGACDGCERPGRLPLPAPAWSGSPARPKGVGR
jgi:NADH:ubiquinone oxidoreductase subunit F (NADH-binding)